MSIRLTVNGEERAVGDDTTVQQLLDELGAGPRGIAVARNEDVVPRSRWGDVVVLDGDRVEILDAAQGG